MLESQIVTAARKSYFFQVDKVGYSDAEKIECYRESGAAITIFGGV